MLRAEALKILGLDDATVTAQSVAEAFRAKAKQSHPDTASRGESNVTLPTMDMLTKARKVLLESLDGTDLCCRLCVGRGMVRSGMGWRRCVTCKGTGERR